MKFAQMLCALTLAVTAAAAPRFSEASGNIEPTGWYRVERDIRGQYTDVQANGRRSELVHVQVNRGEMVRGDTIQRLVREGVASQGTLL